MTLRNLFCSHGFVLYDLFNYFEIADVQDFNF